MKLMLAAGNARLHRYTSTITSGGPRIRRGTTSVVPCPRALGLSTSPDWARSCGAAPPASCPARARCASAPHQIRLTVWRGTTSAVPCPCALRLSTSQDQADSVPASPSHHATTPCTLPAQLKAHRAAPQLCVLNRRNFQSAHASTCVPCRTHQERSHAEEHHPHKVWRPTAVDILFQFYAVLHTAEALPTQRSVDAQQAVDTGTVRTGTVLPGTVHCKQPG